MERLSFYIDKKITYVQVLRTSNKNMYLKIKDEKIIVSAPHKLSLDEINNFVSQHINSFNKYIQQSNANRLYSINDKFVFLIGTKYSFDVLTGFSRSSLKVLENKVYIHCKSGSDEEIIRAIKGYLKKYLINYCSLNQEAIEKKMNVAHHDLSFRYKSSNWGVNYINKKKIILSTRLSHFSDEVIYYVLVHELAHYFYPNHQKEFWALVQKHCPDYKNLRKKLKANKSMDE